MSLRYLIVRMVVSIGLIIKNGLFSALLVPRKDAISTQPNTKTQFKLCGALKKLHRTKKGITRDKVSKVLVLLILPIVFMA